MEPGASGGAGQRPPSMTFVAVLLLGGAVLAAGTLLLTFAIRATAPDVEAPAIDPQQGAVMAAGALLRTLAGIGVLRRWGWTRWVYAAWAVPVAGLTFAAAPLEPRAIAACAVSAIVVTLLFTPVAGAWFRAGRDSGVAGVFR